MWCGAKPVYKQDPYRMFPKAKSLMTFLLAHDEETVRVLMRPSIEENATDFVKETIRRTVKQLVAAGNEEYDWIGVFCELDTPRRRTLFAVAWTSAWSS